MALSDWQGLTIAQLAEITDKSTYNNKSYWEAHAYAQIYDLVNSATQTWINVKDHGATGDGSTDDYTNINTANTLAGGASGTGIIFFPKGTYVIGTNFSFSANSMVILASGASLAPASGVTVTINTMGLAPPTEQIFGGAGTVTLADGACQFAYADWWANIATAVAQTTNNTTTLFYGGGIVLSRMTTAQRNAVSSAPNGMIIYNSDSNVFQVRENGLWKDIVTTL